MKRSTFLRSIPVFIFLPSVFRQQMNSSVPSVVDHNEVICKEKFELASALDLQNKPIDEVIIKIAKSFIGIGYAADPIEAEGPERLVVNLEELDCVTFYENSLVIARCIKKNALTFGDYKKELQYVRYRKGIIDGYPSRLHYTSDYFYDNECKGVLEDVTKAVGGVLYEKKIDFMSANSDKYPKLKESPEFTAMIQKIEEDINSRTLYHIPKKKVKKLSPKIKDGDILGVTTSIKGLDCSHTGIAVWKNRKLHMLHAPSPGEKVQITKLPLWDYLAGIKKDLGIIVVRPIEP